MTWSKLFDLYMQGDDERMKEIVRELRAHNGDNK